MRGGDFVFTEPVPNLEPCGSSENQNHSKGIRIDRRPRFDALTVPLMILKKIS